jgi:hypothetical protein
MEQAWRVFGVFITSILGLTCWVIATILIVVMTPKAPDPHWLFVTFAGLAASLGICVGIACFCTAYRIVQKISPFD